MKIVLTMAAFSAIAGSFVLVLIQLSQPPNESASPQAWNVHLQFGSGLVEWSSATDLRHRAGGLEFTTEGGGQVIINGTYWAEPQDQIDSVVMPDPPAPPAPPTYEPTEACTCTVCRCGLDGGTACRCGE